MEGREGRWRGRVGRGGGRGRGRVGGIGSGIGTGRRRERHGLALGVPVGVCVHVGRRCALPATQATTLMNVGGQGLLLRIAPESVCHEPMRDTQRRRARRPSRASSGPGSRAQDGTDHGSDKAGGGKTQTSCKFSAALKSRTGAIIEWADAFLHMHVI
jgi:hypothetical protein